MPPPEPERQIRYIRRAPSPPRPIYQGVANVCRSCKKITVREG